MNKDIPPTLKIGMTDSFAVLGLQMILLARGINPKIRLDGDFCSKTEKGVIALQNQLGIKASGEFNLETKKKLYQATGFDFDIVCHRMINL